MPTFYDLLQVSPLASQAVIAAAHERLSASIEGNDAAAASQRKALNDAFFTLGDPERRERYDRILLGLAVSEAPTEKSRLRSKAVPIVLWLGACAVVLGYIQYNRTNQMRIVEHQEQRIRNVIAAEERQMDPRTAEEKEADREADRRRREEELRLREERQKQQELERAERDQQRNLEQTRREADDNMRRRLAAEEQAAREHDRELREKERLEKQALENEYREAQRRLEREKSAARRLEAENDRYRRPTPY